MHLHLLGHKNLSLELEVLFGGSDKEEHFCNVLCNDNSTVTVVN